MMLREGPGKRMYTCSVQHRESYHEPRYHFHCEPEGSAGNSHLSTEQSNTKVNLETSHRAERWKQVAENLVGSLLHQR